jgi:hypothetical protein
MRRLEEAFKESPNSNLDDEGSSSPDVGWAGGQDFIPALVDETKCIGVRVDEDGTKRYIIDLV